MDGIKAFGAMIGLVLFIFLLAVPGAVTSEAGDPSFVKRYHTHPGTKPGESPTKHAHIGGKNSHTHGWPECSVKATVQAHTHVDVISSMCALLNRQGKCVVPVTILYDANGNSYEEKHHLGNIGDTISIKRPC